MRSLWPKLCAFLFLLPPLFAAEPAEPPDLLPIIMALREGDFTQALALAQSAATVQATPEALGFLGTAQLKLQQLSAAEVTAAKLAQAFPQSPESIILSGKIALARGQARAALPLFQQALAKDPENSEALAGRGRSKFLLGLDDFGESDLHQAGESLANMAEAQLTLGQIAARAGRLDDALDSFAIALEHSPDDPDVLFARAQLYLSLKLRPLAQRDLQSLLARQPAHAAAQAALKQASQLPALSAADAGKQRDAWIERSVASLRADKNDAARSEFRQAQLIAASAEPTALDPALTFFGRGERLATAGLIEPAKDDYREILSSELHATEARFRIAQLFTASNDPEGAIAFLSRVEPQDPAYAKAQLLLVQAQLAWAARENRSQHLLEAERALAEALAQQPQLATADSIREALRAARASLTPQDLAALEKLALDEEIEKAQNEAARGNLALARSSLDVAIQRFPRNAQVYRARQELIKSYGDAKTPSSPDSAILRSLAAPPPKVPANGDPTLRKLALADLAVHRRPYASQPYIDRARLNLSQPLSPASLTAILADARLAIELEPLDPEAHVLLADALIARTGASRLDTVADYADRQNQRQIASQLADHALELAPEDFKLLLWRGDLERDHGPLILKRESNAMRFYTRALRIYPHSIPALLARADVAGKLKRDLDAAADYRTALTLSPNNLFLQYQLGLAQLFAGLSSEAANAMSSVRQSLARPNVGSPAEILEVTQLHVIALAAAGDNRFEPLARDVLARSEWIGHAETALNNLTGGQRPHSAQLARLKEMPTHPAPDMPRLYRDDGRQMEIDATPTLKKR